MHLTASNHKEYFEYLRSRSRLGLLYRNHWLYPRLCGELRGHILDVGCGIGDFLKFRKNTTGTDINPESIKFCQKIGLDVSLMEPDHLPFGTEGFDGAVLDNVLEHLEFPGALLKEIHRVIKPGGMLIVGVPGARGYSKDPDHKVFYDERRLVSTVSLAGFNNTSSFYLPFKSALLDRYLSQYCLYSTFRRERA